MQVSVAGETIFFCPTCRKIWGEMRHKLAIKYVNSSIRSEKYKKELRGLLDSFCRGRKEKVEFT
jgi:hypothetical protein